jgi:hypothetical protein
MIFIAEQYFFAPNYLLGNVHILRLNLLNFCIRASRIKPGTWRLNEFRRLCVKGAAMVLGLSRQASSRELWLATFW